MEKTMKHTLFIFPFLLNNWSLSELSDLEEANESSQKLKCGRFKNYDFRFMFFIKNLKEMLSKS